jgi:hypothetical protein
MKSSVISLQFSVRRGQTLLAEAAQDQLGLASVNLAIDH